MFDVVIAGATVWPGDAPPFEGDVAVSAGRIVLVTVCYEGAPAHAAVELVDGRGLMLCPGFIDLHTHSALVSFEDPFLTPKLAQGFTWVSPIAAGSRRGSAPTWCSSTPSATWTPRPTPTRAAHRRAWPGCGSRAAGRIERVRPRVCEPAASSAETFGTTQVPLIGWP